MLSDGATPALLEAGKFHTMAVAAIARVLTPSFSDCFFIAVMVWLFVCGTGGWASLLGDGDTGWHIRTGQYILEHHSVPTHDLFSFSRPHAPWFAWEWLTDVLYALSFRAGGLKAIVLMAGFMISLFATVVLRYTLWQGANVLVAAFTTLVAMGASSMHFLARPHLFTLLLLPICLWLLEADRVKHTSWLWALIPLTALWANLHGGFVAFLACLGLLVLAGALESLCGRPQWREVRRYAALLLGCSLSSLLNPYGFRLQVHIVEYLRADWIKNMVQEFQAPTFRSEGQLQFEALLVVGLITAGLLIRRRLFAEVLWMVFLAHASLISVRHAPLFATVAAPMMACEISEEWRTAALRLKKSSVLRILWQLGFDLAPAFRRTSIWPAVLMLALASLDGPLKWPHDFPSQLFPATMVDQHADLIASGRLLTTDQWGDYIIFRFYPRQKVYVDGRSDFYGEKLGGEYLHLLQGAHDWKAILDRNAFNVALLPGDWPLASMLKLDPEWRVVDDDSRAILFERLGRHALGN